MLTFGNLTRDPTKIPEASLKALLARGFAHYLGNEQASKIVGKIRQALVEGTQRKVAEVSKEEVRAFREAHGDQIGKWEDEAREEALKALDAGTMGVRVATGGGPRLDPVAAGMAAIAKAEVRTILKANNLKEPKGEETLAFGNGQTRTMAQMIEKRLADHGERIKKESEQAIAAQARKMAKVKAEAGSAEGLGL